MFFADLPASRTAFYATVATVLPIIMLALAFQIGVRGVFWPDKAPGRKMGSALIVGVILVVAAIGWSEWSAISSLADGVNHDYDSVLLGAKFAIFLLVASTVAGVADKLVSESRKDQQRRVWQTVGNRVAREEAEKAIAEDAGHQPASPPDEGDGPEPQDGNDIAPDTNRGLT